MPYDLVVRNGSVVDGSGSPPFRADVAIHDGTIVSIGRVSELGREEIDAEGHVVTPGFIDGHTHMDAQVMWDSLGTCSCWHGVTTVVMGNCGFTLAPARPNERHLVMRSLERAEDISRAAMAEGIEWCWETFPEYLAAVDRLPKGINYAANIGHSALRTWAMGERAFAEASTDDDLVEMERELRSALSAGAIGFTTSLNPLHQTSDGRPVASRLASWDEVTRLVSVMGEAGAGIFELAQPPESQSPDDEERARYFDRLRSLALDTGVPVTFGTLPNRPRFADQLACIDATVAAGGRMFGQSHSRGIWGVLSFKTSLAFDRLPEWRQVRDRSLEEQRELLLDGAVRQRLIDAAHRGDYSGVAGAEPRPPDFELLCAFDHPLPPHTSIAELARRRAVDPVELMIDLALESDFEQLFIQPFARYDDADIVAVMKHPGTVMTFSDSGAHVSQIMDSSIQTHLLAYWVRERQAFTLQEAVRMVTSAGALAWGFSDRGLVREGLVADLNVFDPERIGPEMPIVVADLPAGAKRLRQEAAGILATVVGGQIVHRDGQHTGALPGRLLRGPRAGRRATA